MTDIWYYEPRVIDGSLRYDKILLVISDNHVATAKYNLTQMGLEEMNTYKELQARFGDAISQPYNKED